MGQGVVFRCSKCGCNYMMSWGEGFIFPMVYERTVGEIREGAFGEEIRRIFEERDDLAVDCGEDLFVCSCGNWTTETNLDVYEPLTNESGTGGARDYYMREDLKKDFRLLSRRTHVCARCGRKMKRIGRPWDYAMQHGLACPECGTVNTADPRFAIMID